MWMKQLSDEERTVVIQDLEEKRKTVTLIVTVFRVFGLLQIAGVVWYVFFGGGGKENIPVGVVICVLLFLIYFKFTGWIAKKNQWNCLLTAVKEKKEYVAEGELQQVYKTWNSNRTKRTMLHGTVLLNGNVVQCRAAGSLENALPGTRVGVIGIYEKVEYGCCYAAVRR